MSDIAALELQVTGAATINTDVVDALNRLCQLYLKTNVEQALQTAVKAVDGARNITYVAGEARALLNLGQCEATKRNYPSALTHYNLSLKLYDQLGDIEGRAEVLAKIGNVNLFSGNYNEALVFYDEAILLRIETGDKLGTADLYANSGIIYGFQGNFPLALKSHLKALKTFESLSETSRIASSALNIGLIYSEQKNYDSALGMFSQALAIREAENNHQAVGDILNNIGNVYHEQERFDEAVEVHNRALALREKLGDKLKIGSSYANLGIVYKSLSQLSKALDYFNRALLLFTEVNEKRRLTQLYNDFGKLHFDLGEYSKAHQYLDKAIELATETGLKNLLLKSYEYQAGLYAAEENYKEAYRAHVSYTRLDKEVSSTETNEQIARINMRHEIEQKEQMAEAERVKNTELKKAYDSLEQEKQRSEELLLNILPPEVSEELKQSGKTRARSYDMVTVLFADIKDFTIISEQLTAEELVTGLDEFFEAFDVIVDSYDIEKIKTIGDAYLCAGGVPVALPNHAQKVVSAALDFFKVVEQLNKKREQAGQITFSFRIGIHSGPLVAGVVGIKKFAYDIWGDTVNTAARMQANGEPGRINISHSTYMLIKDDFKCHYRGEIEAKNKGKMKMYFVD